MIEMTNNVYLLLIDKTEEEILNKPLFKSLSEVKEVVEDLISKVYKTGKPYHRIKYPLAVNR